LTVGSFVRQVLRRGAVGVRIIDATSASGNLNTGLRCALQSLRGSITFFRSDRPRGYGSHAAFNTDESVARIRENQIREWIWDHSSKNTALLQTEVGQVTFTFRPIACISWTRPNEPGRDNVTIWTIAAKYQIGSPMQPDAGASNSASPDLEQLMVRYQQADKAAVVVLVELLSPQLYRFFASQMGCRNDAEDMLQDVWLRVHRVRHTYRPGEPVLPWVYAIARRVRVDNFRKRRRIASREMGCDVLPEPPETKEEASNLPPFKELVASLPESQREVLTMLKVNGLSIEEVARATSSTVGSVKQKAHRAYCRLRNLLERAATAQPANKGVA
jgi:RNA polymerase sigma-70 factor, ECF subfamily